MTATRRRYAPRTGAKHLRTAAERLDQARCSPELSEDQRDRADRLMRAVDQLFLEVIRPEATS